MMWINNKSVYIGTLNLMIILPRYVKKCYDDSCSDIESTMKEGVIRWRQNQWMRLSELRKTSAILTGSLNIKDAKF
ncbi:hypothetical protein HAL01_04230 [Halolactibacillus alkaliphilus]|uniref:Uncharacterized protein n=1 Tax=Halolactibacillus alkaliphilus TaxID=442899 RepID=A0A511WXX3_9BACI|nr:hypothetical protein HAL01_04230 [Halolactibacillus alkaliphilus]